MGKAQEDLLRETAAQAKAQTELLSLLQQVHSLRREEAAKTHSRGHQKLAKLESQLAEKEQAGADERECADLRAQIIVAKGKLDEASGALATCLSTKKVIQAKIDAVEKARDSAQKGLDQCLATKARLKVALDECHKRRDSAREKLQACLDRKVVLKKKIAMCHEKRDLARTKLAECLSRKKVLKAKIAEAKAKIASPQLRSSLLEMA